MIFELNAVSDTGCVRMNNEDIIVIGEHFIRDQSYSSEIIIRQSNLLIAVADGMGGHNAGELASEFVARRMASAITLLPGNLNDPQLHDEINAQVKEIHGALNQLGAVQPQMRGLGTTLAGLLLYEEKVYSLNIGDSRIYRMRGGYIAQMTRDHTLSNMLNDHSIPANQIANSFGGEAENIFLDFEEITRQVLQDDILLICSDGLTGELSNEELEMILLDSPSAESLVAQAKNKGGRDNVSCIVIKVNAMA